MRLLLGSGGLSTDERRENWIEVLDEFLGPIERILFVPQALPEHDHYVAGMRKRRLFAARDVEALHQVEDPIAAVERADAIYVGGGNTFRLLAYLQQEDLLGPIRSRVERGMPYVGISAGTNVACPTIQTTNDMPITWPRGGPSALGLVPYQINAHYFGGATWVKVGESYVCYGGETRDDRLREFHEMNTRPILALWEGGWVRVEGSEQTIGGAPARWLMAEGAPRELVAGDPL